MNEFAETSDGNKLPPEACWDSPVALGRRALSKAATPAHYKDSVKASYDRISWALPGEVFRHVRLGTGSGAD